MKKIIIFSGYYLPHLGGVERYVDKLSKALINLGVRVVIVTTHHEDSLAYEEEKEGIKIYRLPVWSVFKQRYPLPRSSKKYKELIEKIKKENGDFYLLNTRFHLTSLVGARIARSSRKRSAVVEHGTAHFSVGHPILDQLGKVYEHFLTFFLKRIVKDFYGVSQNCNRWLRHFKIKAKGVLYNAVSKDDMQNTSTRFGREYGKSEIVIAYAGRVMKEKGVLNLLEAFQSVQKDRPNLTLRLAIAGDGPAMKEVALKCRDNRAVTLLGRLDFDEVKALYKRTDIFVYPSLYPEGLPTSILEAALFECAVIATPRGGTEEVIPDRDHGIIIDGSVDSIQSAILRLIDNPEDIKRLGKNINKRVNKDFTWPTVAQKVHELINAEE